MGPFPRKHHESAERTRFMLLPLALPPANAFSVCVTALQCANLLAGLNEVQQPTKYSKFAPTVPPVAVSSRTGMLIIYGPALAVSAASVLLVPHINGREVLTAALLALHFAKRCAEVLFVHKYSG